MMLPPASGNTPQERLKSLGLVLPAAASAVAAYEPCVVAAGILYMSGQLPWISGKLVYKGKIGSDLTAEDGYKACQLAALNALAQLDRAVGLEAVKRIIRIEGVINAAPGFSDTPRVLNGASHLVNEVFGERGRHTRMIYTNPEMPFDCACLVHFLAEV